MRIKLYTDIRVGMKKEDIFFSTTPNSHKMMSDKRFEVIVNLPELDDLVDFTLNAHSVEEIEQENTDDT